MNGRKAAKQSFYRSLTLLSVPARYGEAFGLYLVEAMASGVPVIQPRTAAFPELIQASGGGVLFEPGSDEELAHRVAELLRNQSRYAELSQAGRKAALEQFSVDKMAESVAQLYSDLTRIGRPAETSNQ